MSQTNCILYTTKNVITSPLASGLSEIKNKLGSRVSCQIFSVYTRSSLTWIFSPCFHCCSLDICQRWKDRPFATIFKYYCEKAAGLFSLSPLVSFSRQGTPLFFSLAPATQSSSGSLGIPLYSQGPVIIHWEISQNYVKFSMTWSTMVSNDGQVWSLAKVSKDNASIMLQEARNTLN